MTRLLRPEDIRGLSGNIALDVETSGGFQPHQGALVGLGIWAPDAGVCGYLPCLPEYASHDEICDAVASFSDEACLIGHNLKYELRWLKVSSENLKRWQIVDTLVAEHLIHEELSKDLSSLESRYMKTRSKKRLLEESLEHGGIKKVDKWPLSLVAEYCENDCRVTYEVARILLPRIRAEGMIPLWRQQMRYLRSLYRMEARGIVLDTKKARETIAKADRLMLTAMDKLEELCDEAGVKALAKWNSPKKLSALLYEDLGLPKPECPPELRGTRKESAYSGAATGKALLEQLNHPIPNMVLKFRKVSTLRSYLSKYLLLMREIDEDTGIIYSNFNQAATVTARLSSTGPNMQQVSSHAEGKELDPDGVGITLRPHFIAREGFEMVSIDYKQMEVVLFALLCRDPLLMKLVSSGEDVHDLVAELLYGKRGNPYRKWTKGTNFGILYGMGIPALAATLGISVPDATEKYNHYLSTFARVRPWMRETEHQLAEYGFVRYWSGRKRRIRDKRLFYQGVNSLVQGGCADLLSHAVTRVDEYLESRGFGEGLIAPVHDELLMEIRSEDVEQTVEKVREIMSVPDLLGQAFNTDAEWGKRWGENEEVGASASTAEERLRLMRKEEDERLMNALLDEEEEA